MGDYDFGDIDEPFKVTLDHLKGRVCQPDEPYVDPEDPYRDHGHTNCFFMGWAITEIERLTGQRDALARLAKLNADFAMVMVKRWEQANQ
jgi:hypothetical protein